MKQAELDQVPLAERRYILKTRDGLYVRRVVTTQWETVKTGFHFTKHVGYAQRFSYNDLWAPHANTSVGSEFTRGFAGGIAERVK